MGDDLKKVQSGDPLVIPARTFNAFIDAAFDFRRRQRGIGREGQAVFHQLGIIPVRNDTGEDLDRFAVVGVDAPIIKPTDNLDEFKNRATAIGVRSAVPQHRGRFAVYLEPVKAGKIAPACVSGVIPCRINVDEETHERADVEHDSTTLLTGHHGGAEILWKEEGKGPKWALVKVGIAEPLAITFDVRLEQAGGEPGDNCVSDCTLKYDIFDIHTGEKLNKDGPQEPIQSDIRPKKTQMIAATRGTAYWTVKDNAIVVQLEEAFEEPTPRAQQYVVTGIECDGGGSEGDAGEAGGGSSDCCCITIKYHTSKVCYPPGVKLEEGPTHTIRCGDCGSSSSGSTSGSTGPPSEPPSGPGGPSGSSSFGSSSGSSGSSGSSDSSGSSSFPSSGPPSSGPPELPPPPTEPGYYQLCVCYDGTVHWHKVSETSCGSSSSEGSSSNPPPPPPPSSSGSPSGSGSSGDSSGGSESGSSSPSSSPPSSGSPGSSSQGSNGSTSSGSASSQSGASSAGSSSGVGSSS